MLLAPSGARIDSVALAIGMVNVKAYGAKGDGVTDDIAALDLATAYAIAHNLVLYLPPGVYYISRPWVIGAVDNLTYLEVRGSGGGYLPEATPGRVTGNTVIYSPSLTTPAVILQAMRGGSFEGIGVVGLNTIPGTMTDQTSSVADYLSPGVRNDRYSPQCGIAVDALSGSTPTGSGYASLTYAGTSSGSSPFAIRHCAVRGFNVAIAVSVNGGAGNGDAVMIEYNNLFFNATGIAWGSNQTRSNLVRGNQIGYCRVCYDTITYGAQAAPPPQEISGDQLGPAFGAFAFGGGAGTCTLNAVRAERIKCIGYYGAGGSNAAETLTLNACEWALRGPDGTTEHVAPAILQTGSPVRFIGGKIGLESVANTRGLFNFAGNGGRVTLDGTVLQHLAADYDAVVGYQPDATSQTIVEKRGVFVYRSDGSYYLSDEHPRMNLLRYATGGRRFRADGTTQRAADFTTDYVYRPGTVSGGPLAVGGGILTNVAFTSSQVSFDTDAAAGTFRVGDLVMWPMNALWVSGQGFTVPSMVVASVSGTTITCTLLFPRARYDEAGTACYVVLVQWAPAVALTADTTNTSPTLANVSPTDILRNGDYVTGTNIPSGTRVASGGGTATITLTKNATGTATVSLSWGRLREVAVV